MAKKSAIEPQLDELFQAPLSEFTGRRDELAAALRKQGQAGRAAELKALKKPPVSAWAVNQLFFRERPLWNTLAEAGAALRRTQSEVGRGGAADALRKASKDLMRALTSLRARAAKILEASGHAAAEGTLSRIATTLHALAVGEPGAAVQRGRLVADVDPPGFDALTAALGSSWTGDDQPSRAAAPSENRDAARPRTVKPTRAGRRDPAKGRPSRAQTKEKEKEKGKEDKQRARAEREASARRARARAAQTALQRAERELEACSRAVTAATNQVVAARQALTAAEATRTVAERAERAARKKAERARRVVEQLE